jgi:mevalonate kinase
MPAFTATAPGKVILFGEHAVVYGRPAIAVPVREVQARVVVTAQPLFPPGDVLIQAPVVDLEAHLGDLPVDHPLKRVVLEACSAVGVTRPPACSIRITSTIPVAAGMGSGAAVSVAILRAFSAFLGRPLPVERISTLAFEVDKLYHGTPSGIDNTVITYAMPVYFMRGQPVQTLALPVPFTIIIGDTGVASPTSTAVSDVRHAWQSETARYEALFESVGRVSQAARQAIEGGQTQALGPLMDENQALLREIGVSSPEVERLVDAARAAGAQGAKLSGGGRGGNMIALASKETTSRIAEALSKNGARRTIVTTIRAFGSA